MTVLDAFFPSNAPLK
jgi:tRNA pseudouridine55 synthase